ncbi:MAG TPA: hypothetical protein VGM54_20900 [Chthoniobacter sp.]|jgi:hypothetical protein
MPTRLLPALALLSSLLLAGCFPEATNPLSTPSTSTVDARLEGVYVTRREKPDDPLSVWHLHYRAEKGTSGGPPITTPWLEILNIEHPRDKALVGTAYRVLTTRLGSHDYMSILELGNVASPENGLIKPAAGESAKLYWIARYEIEGTGVLRVWMMNTKALEEAMKAGKIRGQVKPHKEGDDVLLTESTEALSKFVTKSDPATLFGGKPIVLYRLSR